MYEENEEEHTEVDSTMEGMGLSADENDHEALAEPESSDEEKSLDEIRAKVMDNRFKWYVVHTYSGFEESAKAALVERIVRHRVDNGFGEIVVPKTIVERTLKSGKKKKVDKTSFPGYILGQMDLNDSTMACVTGTPRITGFVGNHRNPRPMSDQEVLRLLSPDTVGGEVEKAVVQELSFIKGETIKVTDGPFSNFDGIVEEVKADKMRLRVLVSIFGRETPVELTYNQVAKMQ
jgi:transcriptional antiterminator NusG